MIVDPVPPARALRIVSLNLWGGLALDPLLDFVRQQAPAADLFCFQEAIAAPELLRLECGFRTTLYRDLAEALPDFEGAFDPVVSWPSQPRTAARFGCRSGWRRSPGAPSRSRPAAPPGSSTTRTRSTPSPACTASSAGSSSPSSASRPARCWSRTTTASRGPASKLDSDERLEQSRAIRRVLDAHDGPVALVGDFNLLPETESVRLLSPACATW